MTLFSDLRLPEPLSYGSTGGALFSTDVMQTHNGAEYRKPKWEYPVSKYNLLPALDTFPKLRQIQTFFRLHRGKAVGFRFKDFLDFAQEDQIIAKSDGKKRSYKLFKSYWYEGQFVKRRIFKPVEHTVEIFVNNKFVDAEVDYRSGTFKLRKIPKPGDVITANFEFDIPVRFDTDFLELTADVQRLSSYEIPVIEIKDIEKLAEVFND